MKDEKNQKTIDDYDYLSNAASKQDCTGLIPSEPISIEELESYEDLYHFLPPNAKVANIKPEEQSYINQKRGINYAFHESSSNYRSNPGHHSIWR